ncbi:NAD(+) diphosphatase [Chitinibacter bivalviorum]|uniref:NAD(+) diphosphatase n=2 Tax=Chitinibacter bivalviorum TaxID=2739434 RepID=A0A7H9BRS5_9NEIS|nr:NAD(+) diphosphatase [Chitinibacter bivalviorum]
MLPDDFTPSHTPIQIILPDSIFIGLHGDTLIFDKGELAKPAALANMPAPEQCLIIGYWQGQAVQIAIWPEQDALPPELEKMGLRASYEAIGEALWLLAGRASQIATFYRTHRFCGLCGGRNQILSTEVACECSVCQHRVWPRISPAVMVLIRRGDGSNGELLLARSPHFRAGMYSAVAGFVEPGESLEQCAHREVLEEVGVRIKNLRWFGSQSWAFPHSLMLAFIADYESGDIVCQEGEIEDAQWFSLAALPELPSRYSLAWRLLDSALNHKI